MISTTRTSSNSDEGAQYNVQDHSRGQAPLTPPILVTSKVTSDEEQSNGTNICIVRPTEIKTGKKSNSFLQQEICHEL